VDEHTSIEPAFGAAMHALMAQLYPICRSITGSGVRETLRILQQVVPITLQEVASGTPVFDWTVPNEWNIRDAYVADSTGRRVIDFRQHTLHVLNYSVPVRRRMMLDELRPHLFSLPDHPDWIPYRTSYYNENWGFCLSHNGLLALEAGEYEVVIDSTLAPGSLTYGELVIPGDTEDEVLFSTHICHPSMCNDNLSGLVIAAHLARAVSAMDERRFTYRFLFIPGTIGSITWLARNESQVHKIKHGVVMTGLGDAADFLYKKSRRGDSDTDRAVQQALMDHGQPFRTIDFYPYGYDERQFCSPGFNLPVGLLMRSQHGTYPQYHTSGDDLAFVQPRALEDSLALLQRVVTVLEGNGRYLNLSPKGEPQLGKRGIYRAIAGQSGMSFDQSALLWVLNYSDGDHDLVDIASRSGLHFEHILSAVRILEAHQLVRRL
jgi:aminopeptidase-like protein